MGRASRGKRDRRFERNHPKPFVQCDIPTATERCGRAYDKKKIVRTNCAVCTMDVMLHCSDCNIQITGCLCTAVARMDEHELRVFKAMIAEKRAEESGIILPFKQ